MKKQMNRSDMYSTWVQTDKLGRKTPSYEITGAPNGKQVGIFYFLWHEVKQGNIYDHNKAYHEGGLDAVWDMVTEGPLGYAHYWGEPLFGYYRSDDSWIIRKHIHMLSAAGIDFIFLDCSNGLTYPHVSMRVFEVFDQVRREGMPVPKIVFFNGDHPDLNARVFREEWENIYSKGLYKELWYMLDGKPLVLGNPEKVDIPEIFDFFTIRKSWAFSQWDWYQEREGKNCWPWIDLYPQGYGLSPEGKPEQMIVCSGFHSNSSLGRSYAGGKQPVSGQDFGFGLTDGVTQWGLAFEEQFRHAMEKQPPIMMITGWNEWWAGRWEGPAAQGQNICNTYIVDTESEDKAKTMHYVDNFSPEYSRDIEPMRGDLDDNYYCQMVNYIREFKGFNDVPKAIPVADMSMNASEEAWDSVQPTYFATIGNTRPRDFFGFGAANHYINETGRNDIAYAKVARNGEDLYFYVKTVHDMVGEDTESFMNLFINVAPDENRGWEGYSYRLNTSRTESTCNIQFTEGGWNWKDVAEAEIKLQDDTLVIRVPMSALSLKPGDSFDFKWADNSVQNGDIMDFYDKGDTAPDGRFRYRYIEQ